MKFIFDDSTQDQQLRHEQVEKYNEQKIQKRLEKTIRNNKYKSNFYRFVLRNCKMEEIPIKGCKILETSIYLQRLKELDISQMGLTSLENLPLFPTLMKLDITMNQIRDDGVQHILKYTSLQLIYLTENLIQNKETLKQLQKLPNLKEIDVSQNPVNQQCGIQQIFQMLPNLKIFNRYDRNGRDLEKNPDLEDQSSSQSQSSNSEQKQEEEVDDDRESNIEELSDIYYQDQWEQLYQLKSVKIEEEINQMSDEGPRRYTKKLNQMTKEELQSAYQQSKRRLKRILLQMG